MSEEQRDFLIGTAGVRAVAPGCAPSARALRFVAVGALNTAVGYAIFFAALLASGSAVGAAAVSTTLGALFNFLSIGRIVFGSSDPRLIGRFVAVYAILFILDSLALIALERIGLAPALAQAALLPALATLSYLLNRDFVFTQRGGEA